MTDLIRDPWPITNHRAFWVIQPVWSPDGAYILYSMIVNQGWEIFRISVNGGDPQQLTGQPGSDPRRYYPNGNQFPVWSPDGTRIAFHSNPNGVGDIYVMNSDGSGLKNLTNDPASDEFPLWQP